MSDEWLKHAEPGAYTIKAVPGYELFTQSPPPTWECRFFRRYGNDFPMVLRTNAPPNRFHRWAQRLILGHEWVRL